MGPDVQGRETAEKQGGPGPHRPRVDPGESLGPQGLTLTGDTDTETASRQGEANAAIEAPSGRRTAVARTAQATTARGPIEENAGLNSPRSTTTERDANAPGRDPTTSYDRVANEDRQHDRPCTTTSTTDADEPAARTPRPSPRDGTSSGNRQSRKAKANSAAVATNTRCEGYRAAARHGCRHTSERVRR